MRRAPVVYHAKAHLRLRRWLNIPAVGMGKVGNGRNGEGWQKRHRQKIRSATVADGFVRLPPNDGDLGNVLRAG